MTVVTFALPAEGRAFLRRLEARRAHPGSPSAAPPGLGPGPGSGLGPAALRPWTGRLEGRPVTVLFTGVGAGPDARARLTAGLALAARAAGPGGDQGAGGDGNRNGETGRITGLVCAGFAGGLQPGWGVGDGLLAENGSDPGLLGLAAARLGAADQWRPGRLWTAARVVAGAAEKAALGARTGAAAVDMETAWVQAEAGRRGLPTLGLRVISDAWDESLAVPAEVLFDAVRQRARPGALAAYLAGHPAAVAPFVRFVRRLGPAADRLAAGLARVVPALAAAAGTAGAAGDGQR